MTYLITGATGFLGRKLVAQLLSRGDAVVYFARKRSGQLPSQAAFFPWDTSGKPELKSVPRLDGIFHLAGEPIAQRWNAAVKKRIYDSRVVGTRNLVAALAELRHKPSVLVTASAVGYYGDAGDQVLSETSPPGANFLAKVCTDWEQAALPARDLGLRVVPVRIATVLGRDGGALKQMLPPFRLGIGGTFGSGRQWMSWIHQEDLIRLFLLAAETPAAAQPLNGSSPQPVTNSDFTRSLAHILRRPAVIPIPKFALKLALGELADFLFMSQRVIPEATVQSGFTFRHPALEPALESILRAPATS